MDKRRYKKFTDVLNELVQFCRQQFDDGCRMLPQERELAEALGCSRMTLRKALAAAMRQNLLKRKGRFLEITLPCHDISALGKILFVATGTGDKFFLNALKKLYDAVDAGVKKYNGQLELLLTNSATPSDLIREKCMASDIILFTLFVSENSEIDRVKLFLEIGHQRRVIALSDPYQDIFYNYIALDNVAVGVLAAETLHNAGCRKVSCLGEIHKNVIFNKRADGFCEYCATAGVDVWRAPELPRDKVIWGELREQFNSALAQGCDGIFLLRDERIAEVTADAFAACLIPEKVKLISVDGCGAAKRHLPQINCIGHGTRKVAGELMKYLINLSEHSDWPDCRKLITPELYSGKTI